MIFKQGEQEFRFIANELITRFPNEEFDAMLKRYVSSNMIFKLRMGSCYQTFIYAVADHRRGNLSYEQVLHLVALSYTTSLGFDKQWQPILTFDQSIQFVAGQINQVLETEEHADYFQTKDNDKVGTKENPLLLAGVRGVDDYFKALRTMDNEAVSYKRNRALHQKLEELDILYSLDVYELTNEVTGQLLGEVWVNIYGIDNCELCPSGYQLLVGE